MPTIQGYVRKMSHKGVSPVSYFWESATYSETDKKDLTARESTSEISVETWIGKKITLSTNDEIRCLHCGKKTKKSFNQGHCFTCFTKLAENDLCILRPETCHHHKGTCREPDWGKENCFKKHTLYFANSSGLKVGITKENPVSNRWVDQGARFGVPILEVESRRDAGILEHYLSQFLPDKTSWQKMVAGDPPSMDLVKEGIKFLNHLEKNEFLSPPDSKSKLVWKRLDLNKVTEIQYPIESFPGKIKSLKLTKESPIVDTLVGIKGQYLLFQSGVINIRSLSGLWIEVSA
ncbi:DUF2797 domain-containing protein [Leptospira brenneri]|uniref:DUF2797 domain-containing protein n=1 Tax=Leptospira brenneri TaxID=2023182 RepID=A0A2M9Y201_9LEPT|nr:DUF2797 domain-containing protein [Leptospira brenneri]PJZ45600.1 hypothetical protein CH361_11305 [Leptospira brenneri]TGK92093.1 DUF2797 domain-containing protein [Leptospira brenneri]